MSRRFIVSVVFAALLVSVTVVPAAAGGAVVTKGEFATYATGLDRGFDINGHATMVRVPSGKTIVGTHVSGLAPNTAYGSHVHNKACDVADGGGHYQQDPAGGVNPTNEMWVSFTTNSAGIGHGKTKNAFWAGPEAQSIVVHDTDGQRIACADLD